MQKKGGYIMVHSVDVNQATTDEQKRNPVHQITHITGNQKVFISRLLNSVYFSIETCFILKKTGEDFFRILAIHKKTVIYNRICRTLRGARVSFMKKFQKMAWSDKVVAEWTDLYPPDRDWIEKMLSIADRNKCGMQLAL
jgi:hypothetical protein